MTAHTISSDGSIVLVGRNNTLAAAKTVHVTACL